MPTLRQGMLVTPKPWWPHYDSSLAVQASDYVPPDTDQGQPVPYLLRYFHDINYMVSQQGLGQTADNDDDWAHKQCR